MPLTAAGGRSNVQRLGRLSSGARWIDIASSRRSSQSLPPLPVPRIPFSSACRADLRGQALIGPRTPFSAREWGSEPLVGNEDSQGHFRCSFSVPPISGPHHAHIKACEYGAGRGFHVSFLTYSEWACGSSVAIRRNLSLCVLGELTLSRGASLQSGLAQGSRNTFGSPTSHPHGAHTQRQVCSQLKGPPKT